VGTHQSWSLAVVRRADGREFTYERASPSGAWVGDPDINYALESLPSAGGYRLIAPDRTVEVYDATGLLQSISWSDGRWVALGYASSPPSGQQPNSSR